MNKKELNKSLEANRSWQKIHEDSIEQIKAYLKKHEVDLSRLKAYEEELLRQKLK